MADGVLERVSHTLSHLDLTKPRSACKREQQGTQPSNCGQRLAALKSVVMRGRRATDEVRNCLSYSHELCWQGAQEQQSPPSRKALVEFRRTVGTCLKLTETPTPSRGSGRAPRILVGSRSSNGHGGARRTWRALPVLAVTLSVERQRGQV